MWIFSRYMCTGCSSHFRASVCCSAGNTYLRLLEAAKAGAPHVHVHAFSPLEVSSELMHQSVLYQWPCPGIWATCAPCEHVVAYEASWKV